MLWDNWPKRFEAALQACAHLKGECQELIVTPPAAAQQVEEVEAKLGQPLPESFRSVLLNFSAHVEVGWKLPNDVVRPEVFRDIFRGDCRWNSARLIDLEEERLSWIKHCYPNLDDPYDRLWHNKLAFLDVYNGDMLALDLDLAAAPVVYLSHDGSDFHGTLLGKNFADFIERWSLIGLAGAEDWQFEPFVSTRSEGLEPHGHHASQWRDWFGLRVDL
jgi:hypothetical protein